VEMDAPRQAVEADHMSTTTRAELPGTNVAPGGVHGVPIVRTPGDDLPERPEYTAGLKRPSQESVRGGEVEKNLSTKAISPSKEESTKPEEGK
jgi:hypothetical protein